MPWIARYESREGSRSQFLESGESLLQNSALLPRSLEKPIMLQDSIELEILLFDGIIEAS